MPLRHVDHPHEAMLAWVVGNGSRRSDVGNSGLATAGLFSLTGAKARSLYCPRRTAGPYIWVKGRNFPKELNVAAYPTAADAHEMWRFGAVPGFGATVCNLAVMISRLGWQIDLSQCREPGPVVN